MLALKEPLWSRRFKQYSLLVFRRMLDCWWCWGLSRAGGMHIWAGRIQVVGSNHTSYYPHHAKLQTSFTIQVVFARWCVRAGCWLDVCQCCGELLLEGWAWVVVTRCRWCKSRCLVELCYVTWFLWLPWTGQGRWVWFPSSWCGGLVRESVWWWLTYRGVLVCRVLGVPWLL